MKPKDDKKRRAILATAASHFATHPFHKVKLDDVAAAAGVGKGTLYIYFASKEELYFALLYEGFTALVDRLAGESAREIPTLARLRQIVTGLVDFAVAHPELWELMRRATPVPLTQGEWERKRRQLNDLLLKTLRCGVERGELADPHPELTAAFIPGLVRSAMIFGPRDVRESDLIEHIMSLLENGLRSKQ